MIYKPGQDYYGEFTTSNPNTGAAQDADVLPTVTATKNGVDDAAFVLTAAKIDTGRYKITGTVHAGYVAGDKVQVSAAATVASVAGKAVVDSFQIETSTSTDVYTSVTALVAQETEEYIEVEDDIVRDSDGYKTSSIIYIYDNAAHATTHDKVTGLVRHDHITIAYDANKRMTLFKRIPG